MALLPDRGGGSATGVLFTDISHGSGCDGRMVRRSMSPQVYITEKILPPIMGSQARNRVVVLALEHAQCRSVQAFMTNDDTPVPTADAEQRIDHAVDAIRSMSQ